MKLFAKNSSKTTHILKLVSLGITLIILAPVIYFSDPVNKLKHSQLAIKTGSLFYNIWQKPPLDVYVTVYMFNVTNLDAFMSGLEAKLKINEVGPYVYQEILEHKNITFNANNTVTYTPRRLVKFIREKSVGDPKVDKIIAPNIPYMGVTSMTSSFSMFTALALNALTGRLKSKPMLEMSVHKYLWGYDDDLVHLGSKIIPSVIDFKKFGLLERMFNEGDNVVTMQLPTKETSRAQPKPRDYSILDWNGRRTINYWSPGSNSNVTNCNGIYGAYEGTLFPRNITKGEIFRIYRKAFCRTLPIVYSHSGAIDGIEAYHFKLADNTFDSDLDDLDSSCFCLKKKCLKKGLGNITPCYYNMPLAISFPHFLNADPSLVESIDGLHPDEKKHGTQIAIQPQLGIAMQVHARFQINLFMNDVKYNRDVSRFSNTVMPIFWLEISIEELSPGLKILLTLLFKICPYVQCGLIIALIVAGVALVVSALCSCCWFPNSSSSSPTFSKQRQLQKCNIRLLESSAKKNNMEKTNVCLVPLLPSISPKSAPTVPLETAIMCKGEKKLVLLMPPQVDEQKSKSDLKQLQYKFCKRNNTLLPFARNELATS